MFLYGEGSCERLHEAGWQWNNICIQFITLTTEKAYWHIPKSINIVSGASHLCKENVNILCTRKNCISGTQKADIRLGHIVLILNERLVPMSSFRRMKMEIRSCGFIY